MFVVILAPGVAIFQSISSENSMNHKQRFFILLLSGIYAGATPEQENTQGEKNRDKDQSQMIAS